MSYVVNRISSHNCINNNKYNDLIIHFNKVKKIKNKISNDVFNYIKDKKNLHIELDFFTSKEYRESFNQKQITSWELQKLTIHVLDHYNNYIKDIVKNHKFKTQKKIVKKYYKRNTKYNNKGDLKEYSITFKSTLLSNILNYLKYVDITLIESKTFNFNDIISIYIGKIETLKNKDYDNLMNTSGKFKKITKNSKKLTKEEIEKEKIKDLKTIKTLQNKIETFLIYNNKLQEIYKNEKLFPHFLNTLNNFHMRLLRRFNLITFKSGSYIKASIFNKNSSNPTKHSYVFEDKTNIKYKYWYKFKTETKSYYIPLSYNEKYHSHFKDFDLNKEIYVSLSPKGKINFNLYKEVSKPFKKNTGNIKIACDLNVRDNFLTFFDGLSVNEFDYDRTYINQFVEELHKLDKLSKQEKELQSNRQKLEKIIRRNEWYFKNLISDILKSFKNQGVSEITLEDLDLSKSSASFVRSEEFNMKYSRLIRMLRLSKIKDWLIEQSHKFGIIVHLTNPAYSSQECNVCHHIDKKNRDRDTFKCLNCGHSEHSDYNSCKTLFSRTFGNVSPKLHDNFSINNYIFLTPKKLNHKKIKLLIEEHYV